ncbi:MAG: glycosyltransferase family 2 protein, partial [Clostridia bacterium]|nr:glycosyltransferase family 2 protein [Clostridia bacterium]
TYNGGKYLNEQLDSLFSQTVQDFEILVRDDGSTDNTTDILHQYAKKYPNRIRININNPPSGNAKDNFFLLMQDASSDYIMFCDQDDCWLPNKIELTLKEMQSLPQNKPALVHTDLTVADENLNTIRKSFYRMQHYEHRMKLTLNKALAQNTVTGCTTMINKCLCDMAKNTNHKDIIMHDWWLAAIASAFGNVKAVKQPTILYRQHGKNSVGAKSFSQSLRMVKSGEKDLQKSLDKTYVQATQFVLTFDKKLTEKQKKAITQFSTTPKTKPIKRVSTIIRYGFWKQSFIHKLAQLGMPFLSKTKQIFESVFSK